MLLLSTRGAESESESLCIKIASQDEESESESGSWPQDVVAMIQDFESGNGRAGRT